MSLNKYAKIHVSLQVAILSVLNTDFSGQGDVAISTDPIGVQAIGPLFISITLTSLLTKPLWKQKQLTSIRSSKYLT